MQSILRTSCSRFRVFNAIPCFLSTHKPTPYLLQPIIFQTATMSSKISEAKRMKTEDQAVTNFREYLRIPTVHPDPDYGKLRVFFLDTELS